ncbi:hypothetical protein [Aquimarina sp. MMG016]|uniref:hypothetical protein n=1 Tax=Aquimarina sp. MMG016 TaxID=2822690 RepID=UPI001B39E485|nr:hypothetical protein [Aquimarina sp. MMG016]MBQ4821322.1 hypothetical protein [Aquimarina sp. MMG016]
MQLTEKGQKLYKKKRFNIFKTEDNKRSVAESLINGSKDINDFVDGRSICYDCVGFVVALLNEDRISYGKLQRLSGYQWVNRLGFPIGRRWNGMEQIPRGTAIGFKSVQEGSYRRNKFFHSSIGVGGTQVRGVNGGTLGSHWQPANLKTALKVENNIIRLGNEEIEVWLSTYFKTL